LALTLHTIICSTRPGRKGDAVARWFHEMAIQHAKFSAELVDLEAFALPVFDEPKHPRLGDYVHEHTKRWARSVERADAFAFVTPEYNYFAPPALVNALNFLSREWAYKPAGIVSYGGVSGGLRAAQSVKPLLTSLKIMPIPEGSSIPMFGQHVGEDGVFRPSEAVVKGVTPVLDELYRWAEALKPMRD
jgi:NAD(P)H-dependent FMN reductase